MTTTPKNIPYCIKDDKPQALMSFATIKKGLGDDFKGLDALKISCNVVDGVSKDISVSEVYARLEQMKANTDEESPSSSLALRM